MFCRPDFRQAGSPAKVLTKTRAALAAGLGGMARSLSVRRNDRARRPPDRGNAPPQSGKSGFRSLTVSNA